MFGAVVGEKHAKFGLSLCQYDAIIMPRLASLMQAQDRIRTSELPSGFCSVHVRRVPI